MTSKTLLPTWILLMVLIRCQAKYTDCGSSAKIENVEVIPPCDSICTFHLGKNVTFKLTFKTNDTAKSVDTLIEGIVLGIPAPFPLPNPDSCNDGDLKCPLEKDSMYHYEKQFLVEDYFPQLFVHVRYRLVDQDNNNIVCIKLPVKLKDSNKLGLISHN